MSERTLRVKKTNKIDVIQSVKEEGCQSNNADSGGYSSMTAAIMTRDISVIKKVLKFGCSFETHLGPYNSMNVAIRLEDKKLIQNLYDLDCPIINENVSFASKSTDPGILHLVTRLMLHQSMYQESTNVLRNDYAMLKAIENGDIHRIQQLHTVQTIFPQHAMNTAIFSKYNLYIIQEIFNLGCQFDTTDSVYNSMNLAIKIKNLNVIQKVHDLECPFNTNNSEYHSMNISIRYADLTVIQKIYNLGCRFNLTEGDFHSMNFAIKYKNMSVIQKVHDLGLVSKTEYALARGPLPTDKILRLTIVQPYDDTMVVSKWLVAEDGTIYIRHKSDQMNRINLQHTSQLLQPGYKYIVSLFTNDTSFSNIEIVIDPKKKIYSHIISVLSEDRNNVDRKRKEVPFRRWVVQQTVSWTVLTLKLIDDTNHANIIVIDFAMRSIYRYDPHGFIASHNDDGLIEYFMKGVCSEIGFRYFGLEYTTPYFGPQVHDNRSTVTDFEYISPGGFCVSWSVWMLYIMLLKQQKPIFNQRLQVIKKTDFKQLMRSMVIKNTDVHVNSYPENKSNVCREFIVGFATRLTKLLYPNWLGETLTIIPRYSCNEKLKQHFLMYIGTCTRGRGRYSCINELTNTVNGVIVSMDGCEFVLDHHTTSRIISNPAVTPLLFKLKSRSNILRYLQDYMNSNSFIYTVSEDRKTAFRQMMPPDASTVSNLRDVFTFKVNRSKK